MIWNEPTTEQGRHRRATFYALVAFALALYGYLLLDLDRGQTFACAVLTYVLLNARNYRAMFGSYADPSNDRD